MNRKERYEFIEQMFDKLDNLPVESVISRYVDLKPQGRHMMGLCPFHRATSLGAFVVTPSKGMWKCFACEEGYSGNAVKFISLYKNMPYLDAAFDVARENGLISFDEYEKYSKQEYRKDVVNRLKEIHAPKKSSTPTMKANAQIIHNVYQCIKDASPLSEEHKNHLAETRHLSQHRMEADYFTFPSRTAPIIKKIKETYPQYTDEVLKTVPGFYVENKTGKLKIFSVKGIGILIRSPEGIISGIQIRRDVVKDNQSRYIWFSSTFALSDPEKYSGGCGCGSPKDVLYPAGDAKKIICVTEGRFKSEVLAENGNISVSLQGVTAWHGIEETVNAIRNKQDINKIFLFLDADIYGKHELFTQSVKMAERLSSIPDVKIYYGIWRKEYGKGIDDCILAGNRCQIHYFAPEFVSNTANKIFCDVLSQYGVKKIKDVPKEKAEEFHETLQKATENALGI